MPAETIISPHNKIIKQTVALQQKKHRDESGLFLVEGVRLCEDFAASDWDGEYCFYTGEVAEHSRVAAVLHSMETKGCRLIQTNRELFCRIADTEQPQGLMIVARKKKYRPGDLLKATDAPLVVILDELQDPGNVGTIIRVADAAGCNGVILTSGCTDLFAGKTVRSTMGSLFHLPVLEGVASRDLIKMLDEFNITLVATAVDGADLYYETDLRGAKAIVFGNEGRGVGSELLAKSRDKIKIPLYGSAESLNVANAAAIVLYESARQRLRTL